MLNSESAILNSWFDVNASETMYNCKDYRKPELRDSPGRQVERYSGSIYRGWIMKTRFGLFAVFTVALVVAGCGGAGYDQSSSLTFDMTVLQVEGEFLIHGIVYNDLDGDGIMDTGETGVPNAVVTLVGMGDMTTGIDGLFSFDVSEAGAYTVHETDPPGYISTTDNEVSVPVVDGNAYVKFGDRLVEGVPLVDIKPGSDVNPLNLKSNGVLPVAILGSETFDVTQIDPTSLLLNGVPPLRWSYEDVAGHSGADMVGPDMNGDDKEVPDGYEDMTLKFFTQEITDSLGDVVRGDIVTLTMVGHLLDDSPISGYETVWIVQIPK